MKLKHKNYNLSHILALVVICLGIVLVLVKAEPFIFSIVAPNNVKTNDINKTVDLIDLKQYSTITNDSKVYLANNELGHNLTRDLKISLNKPMSGIEVVNMLISHGAKQVDVNAIWKKSYNGVEVFITFEATDRLVYNSQYDNTMWGGLDPNVKYTHYALTFSTN